MLMRVHLQDCDDLFVRDLFGNTFPNHALAHGEIVRGRMSARNYLHTLRGPKESAIFALRPFGSGITA